MEQEKKKCPYCGEEILAVAKKCKHCGEWLNMNSHEFQKKSNEYLIIRNGQQQGPFTIETLRIQHITPDTPVWTRGMSKWMLASQVSELQSLFVVRPARPQYQQVVHQQPVLQPQEQQNANMGGPNYQQVSLQQPADENVGLVEDEYEFEDEEPSTFKKICTYLSFVVYAVAVLLFILSFSSKMPDYLPWVISLIGIVISYIGKMGDED